MIYNQPTLESRLDSCPTKLEELLFSLIKKEDQVNRETIQEIISKINTYYNDSYEKAQNNREIKKVIVNRYEEYIDSMTKAMAEAKEGKVDAKYIFKQIRDHKDERKMDIISFNIQKACKIIFWAATALTLFSSIFMLALPIVIVQPPLGVAMMIAVGGLLLKSIYNCYHSFKEFRFLDRHIKEYEDEKDLLNRFTMFYEKSTTTPANPVPESPDEETAYQAQT